jgi:hypothetical protein
MTVAVLGSRRTINHTGVEVDIDTIFEFLEDTHVHVFYGPTTGLENELTQGLDFTVTGGARPNPAVGQIHLVTPAAYAGKKMVIVRSTPALQAANLVKGADPDVDAIEGMADRLTLMVRELIDGALAGGTLIHGNYAGGADGVYHALATHLLPGMMPAADKEKLDAYPASPGSLVPATYESTADTTLYVATTGNDANAGTIGSPLLTIQAAIDKIPLVVKHTFIINVGAGSFVEKLHIDKIIAANTGARISIVGTLAAFVPATGLASGNIAAMAGRVATVTLAGWTVNDLRDKFLRVTATGELYPICSNAATTVELATTTNLTGLAFDIVQPSTVLQGGNTSADIAIKSAAAGRQAFNAAPQTSLSGIMVRNMEIVAGTGVTAGGSLKVYGCRLKYYFTGYGGSNGFAPQILRCVLLEQAANNGAAMVLQASQFPQADECYARAVAVGTNVGLELRACNEVQANNCLVLEGFGKGIEVNDSVGYLFGGNLVSRGGGTYGLYVFGGNVEMEIDGLEASGHSQYGIYVEDDAVNPTGNVHIGVSTGAISSNGLDGVLLRSASTLALAAVSVTANGRDGIRIMGSHNGVRLSGATDISGNAGWAVKCQGLASLNSIEVGPAPLVMGGNGHPDFSLDNGVTTTTLAALRTIVGPPAARLTDANYLNTLFGA